MGKCPPGLEAFVKIIDTHMHLAGRLFGTQPPRVIADIRQEYENTGVSHAWIMTIDGLLQDPAKHNDILAEAVRPHRDFFVPFCTVNPHEGVDVAMKEMDRAKSDLGMRGLKLHPWLQAFSMTHPAIIPIFKKASQLGFPVLLHDGTPPYCTPLQIASVAEQVPDVIVILGHAGLDDLTEDAILACLRHKNIYLSLTSISVGFMKEIIQRVPVDRLLFGSDGGIVPGLVDPAIRKLRATEVSDDILVKIFYENAAALLPIQ